MEDEIELHRETIEISGGRNLYNYTFTLDGKPLAIDPPKPRPPVNDEGA
jgi:hypothetical protein